MEYKELQKQAKALNLPYNGVSAEDLEKSIKEARKNQGSDNSGDEPSKGENPSGDTKPKEEQPESEKPNAAVVLDGPHEIRRYTKESHGKKFEQLAHEFAGKKGYQIQLEIVETGIACPKCGFCITSKKKVAG